MNAPAPIVVLAAIVAADGAGADAGFRTDMGIADAGEMIDLDACLDRRR